MYTELVMSLRRRRAVRRLVRAVSRVHVTVGFSARSVCRHCLRETCPPTPYALIPVQILRKCGMSVNLESIQLLLCVKVLTTLLQSLPVRKQLSIGKDIDPVVKVASMVSSILQINQQTRVTWDSFPPSDHRVLGSEKAHRPQAGSVLSYFAE